MNKSKKEDAYKKSLITYIEKLNKWNKKEIIKATEAGHQKAY